MFITILLSRYSGYGKKTRTENNLYPKSKLKIVESRFYNAAMYESILRQAISLGIVANHVKYYVVIVVVVAATADVIITRACHKGENKRQCFQTISETIFALMCSRAEKT